MKKLVKFETYLKLEESFNEEYESFLNEELELNEGAVGQVLGWVFVPALMALRQGIRFAKKRQKIRNAVRNESDPKKKEALRKSLKELKYEELRAKEKMDKIIDKCGNPPRGVGIQNLRTCIAEVKSIFI